MRPVARSLERWLRRQAREAINNHLSRIAARLGCRPAQIYVMDQRQLGVSDRREDLSPTFTIVALTLRTSYITLVTVLADMSVVCQELP